MEEHTKHEDDEEDMEPEHMVDALVNLLIKKGIITEDEFVKEYEDLYEDDDKEE